MSRHSLAVLIVVAGAMVWSPVHAFAQRGQLLEGLFRSVVEAELERAREQEEAARRRAADAANRPLPSGPPPHRLPDAPPPRPRPNSANSGPDRKRLESLRDLLDRFSHHSSDLATQLRQPSNRIPGVRELVAPALHLQAHADALARQAAAETNYRNLIGNYEELDGDWRQLSFSLRSLSGLSAQTRRDVDALDDYSNQICRILGIETQFNRERMQDLLVACTTYMEVLLDDLRYMRSVPGQERLIQDGRILEERLRREATFVSKGSLGEIMPRFHQFVTEWRVYSARLYDLNDPYIDRRLERIRHCGSEVFALLSMPASPDMGYFQHIANRLHSEVLQLMDGLSIRALARLPREQQNRILADTRQLYRASDDLKKHADEGDDDLAHLREVVNDIDRRWHALESQISGLPSVQPNNLAAINQYTHELLDIVGTHQALDRAQAIQLAAALEGEAEYLFADIQRYRRYYTPASFASSFLGNSDQFLQLSRRLHSQLANDANLGALQETGGLLLKTWDQLSGEASTLSQHGLAGSRPARIQNGIRETAKTMADLAAMLME
ncbi:hypothetical protein FF011L_16550 [Roseimaritima multifibrata]|uniref:Uncharacterized protein n=1 Tax=Roseimaritima multifibrata TaxID=1930274 RepID=A0A517MDD8_9BACT|nr:hypothetical protein [Roseimaritima multifibrata]QDS92901.1 hypothetical protein FF011L_16550 [Roseimaritima multifibrata]